MSSDLTPLEFQIVDGELMIVIESFITGARAISFYNIVLIRDIKLIAKS